MILLLENSDSESPEALPVEHLSQGLESLQILVTSDMNDAVADLLVFARRRYLVVYEALLAVDHMLVFDGESQSLKDPSVLLTHGRISYLRLT